jgi:O-antigen ligase
VTGATVYTNNNNIDNLRWNSEGWRLNAWRRSLQAITDKPLVGHGVGGWTPAIRQHEGATYIKNFGTASSSNPHQEFLLWGVEMGLVGMALLIGMMATIAIDARAFPVAASRTTWSIVMAMVISCLFNSSLYDDLIGDYFCVALGLSMALGLQNLARAKSEQLTSQPFHLPSNIHAV